MCQYPCHCLGTTYAGQRMERECNHFQGWLTGLEFWEGTFEWDFKCGGFENCEDAAVHVLQVHESFTYCHLHLIIFPAIILYLSLNRFFFQFHVLPIPNAHTHFSYPVDPFLFITHSTKPIPILSNLHAHPCPSPPHPRLHIPTLWNPLLPPLQYPINSFIPWTNSPMILIFSFHHTHFAVADLTIVPTLTYPTPLHLLL